MQDGLLPGVVSYQWHQTETDLSLQEVLTVQSPAAVEGVVLDLKITS